VEPFAGSAGYSLRYPDLDVVLVERDPAIAAVWRFLIGVKPAEVLALPDLMAGQDTRDLGLAPGPTALIGFWCTRGGASPNRTLSAWGRNPRYRSQFWGPRARHRIASQVEAIKHWRIIEGDYTEAPSITATWFIDPPYQEAGRHYRHGSKAIDYAALSAWCRQRPGEVIVCENTGADWLPFVHHSTIKANESKTGGKTSAEAIWHHHQREQTP
jgi:hypothetical protein